MNIYTSIANVLRTRAGARTSVGAKSLERASAQERKRSGANRSNARTPRCSNVDGWIHGWIDAL
eukprot:2481197-Lingulodinium_polyedra.AAC.1